MTNLKNQYFFLWALDFYIWDYRFTHGLWGNIVYPLKCFYLFILIGRSSLYNVALVSVAQQSESANVCSVASDFLWPQGL